MDEKQGLNRLSTGAILGSTIAVSIVAIFLAMIASPLVEDGIQSNPTSELRVPVWDGRIAV